MPPRPPSPRDRRRRRCPSWNAGTSASGWYGCSPAVARCASPDRPVPAAPPCWTPWRPTARIWPPTGSYASPGTSGPPRSCCTGCSRPSTALRCTAPTARASSPSSTVSVPWSSSTTWNWAVPPSRNCWTPPRSARSCSPRRPTCRRPRPTRTSRRSSSPASAAAPRSSSWSTSWNARSPTRRRTGRETSGSSRRGCRCASSRRVPCCASATTCAPDRTRSTSTTRNPATRPSGGRSRPSSRCPASARARRPPPCSPPG